MYRLACAKHPPIANIVIGIRKKKIDYAHRADAMHKRDRRGARSLYKSIRGHGRTNNLDFEILKIIVQAM